MLIRVELIYANHDYIAITTPGVDAASPDIRFLKINLLFGLFYSLMFTKFSYRGSFGTLTKMEQKMYELLQDFNAKT